ncbi:MAG: ABC transporter permease [Actinomycetota bacterium]|jgi:ABC-type dipeptide/oligopeptide/nickel transport system permease component|nr:ABC transporter permease [Actinomycetota bacterium]
MFYYIIKRILQIIPVIIGITLILFILMYVIPEDPAKLILQKGATPQALANLRAKMGIDKPIYVQYWRYVSSLAKGDLGTSYRYRRSVNEILAEHYPNSIKLAFAAIIIETIIGIIAGIISAVKKYSFLDVLVTISTTILVCIPVYWLGMLLQIGFGLKLGWFPMSGMGDGSIRYYILPAITLASVSTAFVARMTRSSMLDVLSNDYIRTAYAKGLSSNRVIFKHSLKNALIPVITYIGIDLGTLMGGAILTETIFAWPGVGRTIYLAILQRDAPVVIGGTIILVLIFVIINLIVDILYAILDPRIRYGGVEANY